MANRAIEPVTLPWKRPEKGVSVAEMGASFRVALREDGWHCTVNVGRRAEVLATGLRRLRDAQCRAEAHAATLPEVAAAREKMAAEERKAAQTKKTQPTPGTDPRPAAPTPTPDSEVPSLAFEQVSDGCICGKIEGGTWVADPGGGVSVPTGTDPVVAQEICRVAAAHYTARRSATTSARASTKPAGKRRGRKAKPVATPVAAPAKPPTVAKPARVAKPAPAKKTTLAKKGKAKPAKEPAAPAPASASKQAKAPRTGTGKAASKKAATKTTTPKAPARGRKASVTEEKQAATSTPPAKAAAKGKKPAARRRKAGKARAAKEKQAPAPTPTAREEKVSKKPAKSSKPAKDASCGCVTWDAVDNKIRGTAKHGTFVVEPEGKRHALYFYDADGQSRHLESGDPGKLRKVAEEMAARGQPVLRAPASGVDDAALMRAFLGDDA